jgi:hypothetical protein
MRWGAKKVTLIEKEGEKEEIKEREEEKQVFRAEKNGES